MKLSPKEHQILVLLSEDKTVKQIANLFNRSTFTIQAQIRNAKLKLGVSTSHGAVAKILQQDAIHNNP
jgi:DNA-binding CsgD family transcriptional regulator